MRRRRVVPHRALVALLLLGLTTASACTREDRGFPGTLAKPLGEYTPDEFYAFAHGLPFGGGADKPRKCKGNPQCDVKGGPTTSARVDAVDGQDSITVRALPANGVVIVRAKNTGTYQEARYSMQPGDFEYYVVLRPGSDSARWSMQQVSTAAGGRTLKEVASGTYVPCNHPFRKLKNRANFYTCTDAHMASDSAMKMGQALQDALMEPIWLSCAMGCCILS